MALFQNVKGTMSVDNKNEVCVAANPDGKMISTWCSCMAGANICCNHVIAMLHKIQYARTNNFALLKTF